MKTQVLALVALIGWSSLGLAQQDWKMQPVVLQSRWAKEVGPENALKEYPRPALVRKQWQNLNGLWEYAITALDAPAPDTYSGKILVPYPLESALSGVQKTLLPEQNLWYRRTFARPALKDGERLLLNFGAVDWQATVFVNGKEVGRHSGGYHSFSFDVTDALTAGENTLTVKVFDPTDRGPNPHGKQVLQPANIYYTSSSGIWQTVWMETVPAAHVVSVRTTPDIDKGVLEVLVTAVGGDGAGVTLTAKAGGKTVKSIRGKAGEVILLPIAKARLWSPDDPFLYDLTVELRQGNKTVDRVGSYFGMRKVAVQKDAAGVDRIFLNNKYTYNLGTLDQGFWPDGLMTAPTDEALAFDIRMIKAMGFNTIRKHIKVEPERWYYHADKTGVMVWQDFVNAPHAMPPGSKEVFEQEAKNTLEQLHNHPSIVTWVLFNEQWGSYDQKRLTEWVKATDPSRIVNGHSGEYIYIDGKVAKEGKENWVSSDMTDVHSYPDPMNSPQQDGKARVLGEFGGIGVPVPGHQWDEVTGWGYVQVSPAELAGRYEGMVKRLQALETEGLSGSIYTQPFDVEGEENGLLTYDREVIKIPVKRMREINQLLVKQTQGFVWDSSTVSAADMDPHAPPPDWQAIEARLKAKGDLVSLEKYYGKRMASAYQAQDWAGFGKYYVLYYETALPHSEYHITNISWAVFQRCSDPKVLEAAIRAVKYDLETYYKNSDPGVMYVYANLLYKAGKRAEAIEWMQKVLAKNSAPEAVKNLEDMKAGKPTWPVQP